MPTTVTAIVSDALTSLRLMPGQATQQYATPIIQLAVEQAFFRAFNETEHLWAGYKRRLSDVAVSNGNLTGDLLGVRGIPIAEFRDVRRVWQTDFRQPILMRSDMENEINDLTGLALWVEPSYEVANRPFTIQPDFTGTINVLVRTRPPRPFALSDAIYMDHDMLVYGAIFMHLAGSGANPGQLDLAQSSFISALNNAVRDEQQHGTAFGPEGYEIPMSWH